MASNAENVSIWWRHHVLAVTITLKTDNIKPIQILKIVPVCCSSYFLTLMGNDMAYILLIICANEIYIWLYIILHIRGLANVHLKWMTIGLISGLLRISGLPRLKSMTWAEGDMASKCNYDSLTTLYDLPEPCTSGQILIYIYIFMHMAIYSRA